MNKKNNSLLGKMLNEAFMNEAVKTITDVTSNRYKSLVVQIDLSKLEPNTIDVLWNDYGINWKKLDKTELQVLYKLLNIKDLEFEEWCEENGFE